MNDSVAECSVGPSVIYIGGYGRSGSTVLDVMLGNQQGIFGGGEMVDLLGKFHSGSTENYDDDTRSLWDEALSVALGRIDAARHSLGTLQLQFRRLESGLSMAGSQLKHRHALFWRGALDSVATRESAHTIVDSSKSARYVLIRPLLFRQQGTRVRYILIVRDPRAVLWSRSRGVNYLLEAGGQHRQNRLGLLRAGLGWLGYTLAACVQYQFFKGQRCVVTYEALMENPVRTCQQMARALDLNLDCLIGKLELGEELEAGRGLSGNRTRRGGTLVLKNDTEWQENFYRLPVYARAMGAFNALVYRAIRSMT